MALHLCVGCNRHVRVSEALCPFCGASGGIATTSPVSRATRAALVFGATVLVAGASAACSDSVTGTDAGPASLYGGAPIDASVDAGPDVSPAPLYGLPADSGADAADAAGDADAAPDGSPAPAYGIPPG